MSFPGAVVDMGPTTFNGAPNALTQFMGSERNSLCAILNLKTLVRLKVAVAQCFCENVLKLAGTWGR